MQRIVLSSGSVNRHGYRIIPEGIKIENYLKNPVLLGFHNDYKLPIGLLKDIRLEEGKLTAEPVFDEKDDEALKFKQKFEDGFLKAVSIYHVPLSFSSEPHLLLPGQTGETVTSTELIEVSFVSIGSDPDAHALNFDMNKLSIPEIKKSPKTQQMELTKEQKELRQKLGLPESATDELVNTKVEELIAAGKNALAARVDTLLALGKQKGFITEANEASYRKLANKDYETVETMINDHKKEESTTDDQKLSLKDIVDAVKGSGSQAEDKETFEYLQKHDSNKLNNIRINEPDKYKALVDAHVKGRK